MNDISLRTALLNSNIVTRKARTLEGAIGENPLLSQEYSISSDTAHTARVSLDSKVDLPSRIKSVLLESARDSRQNTLMSFRSMVKKISENMGKRFISNYEEGIRPTAYFHLQWTWGSDSGQRKFTSILSFTLQDYESFSLRIHLTTDLDFSDTQLNEAESESIGDLIKETKATADCMIASFMEALNDL
jgi:hypothetical protein